MAAKTVSLTNQFKRDAKKQYMSLITLQRVEVMHCLINGLPVPMRYANHPLKGEWKGCMDCHIRPDLILHRLGSHSELSIA